MKCISEYIPKSYLYHHNYKTYSNFREVKIQHVCPRFNETVYLECRGDVGTVL